MEKARHQGVDYQNQMVNVACGYFAKNRIPSPITSFLPLKSPKDISLSTFYTTAEENKITENEMENLLMGIACQHITAFKEINHKEIKYERNLPFRKESESSSEYIETGVIPINISSGKGMLIMLEHLEQYFPKLKEEQIPCRLGGDAATIKNLKLAKLLRSASHPKENYNHVWPSMANNGLHRSMTRTSKILNIFEIDNASSRCSEGSLANIKLVGGHKNATPKNDDYNHSIELLMCTMHGFGTLLMMKHLRMSSIDDEFQATPAVKKTRLQLAAKESVKELLMATTIYNGDVSEECEICKAEIKNEKLVKCWNISCRAAVHSSCANLFSEIASATPKNPKKQQRKKNAKKTELYCSIKCQDQIYKYSMSLLHASLELKIRNNIIKNNDGQLLKISNKQDLEFFHENGRTNYRKMSHDLHLTLEGCAPASICHDEMHNTTVKMDETKGTNIASDTLNEFGVRGSKGIMKTQSGPKYMQSIIRRTRLIASLRQVKQSLDSFASKGNKSTRHVPRSYESDTKEFVKRYKNKCLVNAIGNRRHVGIAGFQYFPRTSEQSKFQETLEKMKNNAELYRNLEINFSDQTPILPNNETPTLLKEFSYWEIDSDESENNINFQRVQNIYPKILVPNNLQLEVASAVVEGKDALLCVPTGFGKSFVYVLSGLLFHEKNQFSKSIYVLIVTPMISIIHDQIKELNLLGLEAIHLRDDLKEQNKQFIDRANNEDKVLYLFITPEYLEGAGNKRFIKSLEPVLYVADEVHLIESWGKEFRKSFKLIGSLRVDLKSPMLAMSATLEPQVIDVICQDLHFSDRTLKRIFLPDRPNVFYDIQGKGSYLTKFLMSIVEGIKKFGKYFPKTIIYVDTYRDVSVVYSTLMEKLQAQAYNGQNSFADRFIQQYFTEAGDVTKKYVEDDFKKSESTTRIVIATVAFGVGINIPDIRMIAYIEGQRSHANSSQIIQFLGRAGEQLISFFTSIL